MEEKKEYFSNEEWIENSRRINAARKILNQEEAAFIRKNIDKYSVEEFANKFKCSTAIVTKVITNTGVYHDDDYSYNWDEDGNEIKREKPVYKKKDKVFNLTEDFFKKEKGKHFNQEQIDFIRQEYNNGKYNITELAKMFNSGQSTITFIINNDSHYDPMYKPRPKKRDVNFTESQIKYIKENPDISNGEIAKIYGVHSGYIQRLRADKIKKFQTGEVVKSLYPNKKEARKFTDEEVKFIRESDMANKKICKVYNVSVSTIVLIRNNKTYFDPNYTPRVRWKPKLTMEDAKEIRTSKLSVEELAEKFDISKNHVWDILANKYNVDPDYIPIKRPLINKHRKLTDEQVREIRKLTYYKDACEKYGISEGIFYEIKKNKIYKDVTSGIKDPSLTQDIDIEKIKSNPINLLNMLWKK